MERVITTCPRTSTPSSPPSPNHRRLASWSSDAGLAATLKGFAARGHAPIGLDGCVRFVEMARALTGCEVWHQDFLELDLPPAHFHGVFANASLFHVPGEHLPRVLAELHNTLAPRGVMFFSNPRGANDEGWSGERYGCYFEVEQRPQSQQPWLAMTWRRT